MPQKTAFSDFVVMAPANKWRSEIAYTFLPYPININNLCLLNRLRVELTGRILKGQYGVRQQFINDGINVSFDSTSKYLTCGVFSTSADKRIFSARKPSIPSDRQKRTTAALLASAFVANSCMVICSTSLALARMYSATFFSDSGNSFKSVYHSSF